MGRIKDLWINAMVAEHDADEYERTRKRRARLARRHGLISEHEFQRELYEAEREACDMRGAAIKRLCST